MENVMNPNHLILADFTIGDLVIFQLTPSDPENSLRKIGAVEKIDRRRISPIYLAFAEGIYPLEPPRLPSYWNEHCRWYFNWFTLGHILAICPSYSGLQGVLL